VKALSDKELLDALKSLGAGSTPITASTRGLLEVKLLKLYNEKHGIASSSTTSKASRTTPKKLLTTKPYAGPSSSALKSDSLSQQSSKQASARQSQEEHQVLNSQRHA
jgi:hypothetical protein